MIRLDGAALRSRSAAGIGMQGMAGGGLLSVRTWTAGRRSIYTTVRSPRRLLPPDRNREILFSYTWLHAYVHQNLFYFVYVLDRNKQTKIYKTFQEKDKCEDRMHPSRSTYFQIERVHSNLYIFSLLRTP
jgi:hypothetical protein